jgi:hypothetical protein
VTWFLPRASQLGRLEISEIFDSYDGPRLFSAVAASGTVYLAFWIGESSTADTWLYVPISRRRLDEVVEGVLTLREAFSEPEDGFVYTVQTPYDLSRGSATAQSPTEIPAELLPSSNDRLSGQRIAQTAAASQDATSQENIHGRLLQRIRIEAKKRRVVTLDAVAQCLAHWSALFTQALAAVGGTGRLLPLSATPGSFNVNLTVPKGEGADSALSQVRSIVGVVAGALPIPDSGAVDLPALRALLSELRKHQLMLTIAQDDDNGNPLEPITLDFRNNDNLLVRLNQLPTLSTLESSDIPQADDLDRVLRLAELVSKDRPVTPTSLDVVERQVAYYKHAARVLRILELDNSISPTGHQLVALQDPAEQRAVLALQFETSRCGWRWIQWCEKTSLIDIDATSAETFLAAVVPGLSPSTAKRRARTLESWCRTLQPFHIHSLMARFAKSSNTDS